MSNITAIIQSNHDYYENYQKFIQNSQHLINETRRIINETQRLINQPHHSTSQFFTPHHTEKNLNTPS